MIPSSVQVWYACLSCLVRVLRGNLFVLFGKSLNRGNMLADSFIERVYIYRYDSQFSSSLVHMLALFGNRGN
jgi:hypothetical protein